MRLKTALVFTVFSSFLISSIGSIGGITLTSAGWLIPLIASHFVLLSTGRLPRALSYILVFWAIFILGHGLASTAPNSIQRSIIIITPVFVAFAASTLRYKAHELKKIYTVLLSTSYIFAAIIFTKTFILQTASIDRLAAEAIAATCLGWICLIHYRYKQSGVFLLCFLLLISIPIAGGNRGPLIAFLIALVLAPPVESINKIAIKAAIAMFLAAFMLVFFPPLSEKMFHAGHSFSEGTATADALQTSGRIQAWAVLIDEGMKAPYLGRGGNASEPFLTSTISEAFSHPHNDYLRLFFDYGIVGLSIFLFTYIALFRRCTESTLTHTKYDAKILRGITFALFIPFFFLMLVDNILLYSAFFGNIHFLLIGINESIKRRTTLMRHTPP